MVASVIASEPIGRSAARPAARAWRIEGGRLTLRQIGARAAARFLGETLHDHVGRARRREEHVRGLDHRVGNAGLGATGSPWSQNSASTVSGTTGTRGRKRAL